MARVISGARSASPPATVRMARAGGSPPAVRPRESPSPGDPGRGLSNAEPGAGRRSRADGGVVTLGFHQSPGRSSASAWRRRRLGVEDRTARGVRRVRTPPVHRRGAGRRPLDRPDPVTLLEQQATRVPETGPDPARPDARLAVHLLPRAGVVMAATWPARRGPASRCSCAGTPTCRTSACSGRRSGSLLFDVNDFDETLPGPGEWDIKRLAASFEVLGRDRGFSADDRRGRS